MQLFHDSTLEELEAQGIGFRDKIPAPSIVNKHIDGPLLYFSDGQLHWLTWWECIQFWCGWTDAKKLQIKLRPRLVKSMRMKAIRHLESAMRDLKGKR